MPRAIGYARVSTEDQQPALQISALSAAGCSLIYCDHGASGADRNRPELEKALSSLQEGDKLVVWKLDRLARSVVHLIQILDDFGTRGVQFESLTEKIDTDTAHGEFVFHVLAGFAQMERRLISERTRAGMASAKARGVRLGRPAKICDVEARRIHQMMRDADMDFSEVASAVGVSAVTVQRGLERYGLRG